MELPNISCDDSEPELPADVSLEYILYEMQKIDAKLDKFYIYTTGDIKTDYEFAKDCSFLKIGVVAKSIDMANLLFFCLSGMYNNKNSLIDDHELVIETMIECGIRPTLREYVKRCFLCKDYTRKHRMNKMIKSKISSYSTKATLRRMPHHIKLYDYYDVMLIIKDDDYESIGSDFHEFQRYNKEYLYFASGGINLLKYNDVKRVNNIKLI